MALDSAQKQQILSAYPFLSNKSTKLDIMQMTEIMAYENTENPKEAIKRLMEEAKERRMAMKLIDFDEPKAKKGILEKAKKAP